MMKYQEFICTVERKMNLILKGGAKASLYTAAKNNGTSRTGIMIEVPGINISPTIYLEEFYERLENGESVDAVVQDVYNFYEKIKYDRSWDVSAVERYEAIRGKIVFKLIHTKKNEGLLKEVPHREFLDLSIVYYALLQVDKEKTGTATLLVKNEHMKLWGVSEEELYRDAADNVRTLLPARLITMSHSVESCLCSNSEEFENILDTGETAEEDIMFVLSNQPGYFGAACIAYPGVADMIGNVLGGNYYVLPSSVHETVLVLCDKGMEPWIMDEMVQDINREHVAEEEILSDHCYIYDVENKRLEMRQYVRLE